MEIQQARTFLAVAREASFSRAARKLFRTQPTVTMAVQKLEREFGAKLFERVGHGVRLTSAGHALAESIGPLLDQWDGARSRLHGRVDGVLRGRVRVGGSEAAVLYLLPGAIRTFSRRHPRVEVLIRQQDSDATLAMLREGEIDLAVTSLPPASPDVLVRPFGRTDRILIGPRRHAVHRVKTLTLEALSSHPFILPRPGSTIRKIVEGAFAERNLPLKIALEASGWEMAKRYAGLGLGIAVVPAFCFEHSDRRIAARAVRHLFGQDAYGVVVRRGRPLPPAAAALLEDIAPRRGAA